jgi:hypothetical protein
MQMEILSHFSLYTHKKIEILFQYRREKFFFSRGDKIKFDAHFCVCVCAGHIWAEILLRIGKTRYEEFDERRRKRKITLEQEMMMNGMVDKSTG